MYARIWTAQVSALRSTVCIGFRTPPSVLPLMEGGGGGPEWNFTLAGPLSVRGTNILVPSPHRLPCVPFTQSPLPQHLPPFVVSCPRITSTKAPLFPPPHLHHTGTYNILVEHATSSTSHPVNRSAGPGGPSKRPPRPQKAELTRTVPDPKRAVIAVVGGG
jgi:hypothetical protein